MNAQAIIIAQIAAYQRELQAAADARSSAHARLINDELEYAAGVKPKPQGRVRTRLDLILTVNAEQRLLSEIASRLAGLLVPPRPVTLPEIPIVKE